MHYIHKTSKAVPNISFEKFSNQSCINFPTCSGYHCTVAAAAFILGRSSSHAINQELSKRKTSSCLHLNTQDIDACNSQQQKELLSFQDLSQYPLLLSSHLFQSTRKSPVYTLQNHLTQRVKFSSLFFFQVHNLLLHNKVQYAQYQYHHFLQPHPMQQLYAQFLFAPQNQDRRIHIPNQAFLFLGVFSEQYNLSLIYEPIAQKGSTHYFLFSLQHTNVQDVLQQQHYLKVSTPLLSIIINIHFLCLLILLLHTQRDEQVQHIHHHSSHALRSSSHNEYTKAEFFFPYTTNLPCGIFVKNTK